MITIGRTIGLSSVSPKQASAPAPRSPPNRTSFLPLSSQLSPSTTRFESSPFRAVENYLKPVSEDPLASFRADARQLQRLEPSVEITDGGDDAMLGIEDVTLSQWERGTNGQRSASPADALEELSRLERDQQRFDEKDEKIRKKQDLGGKKGALAELKARRAARSSRSVSTPSTHSRKLQNTSPISVGATGVELDQYDWSMIDDRKPIQSEAGSSDDDRSDESDGGDEAAEGEGEDDEEEAASSSGESSTPAPTSLVTPHEDSGDEALEIPWTPSPMSPRTAARRKSRSSSTMIYRPKDPPKTASPFFNAASNGDPGPSSSRSVRSRSTARKAAVTARARVRNAVVLSDDEDDDYDPFVGGDRGAFRREYEKQVEQEELEPEETDGSEGDDDGDEGTDRGSSVFRQDEEEDGDFEMLATQQQLPGKSSAKAKGKRKDTSMGRPNSTFRSGWQPGQSAETNLDEPLPIDEYDDLPMDGFEAIDLDNIPAPDPVRQPPSKAGLSDLFSPVRKRPSLAIISSNRIPLSDLTINNDTHDGYRGGNLLQQLDLDMDSGDGGEEHGLEGVLDEIGYMPVSRMPKKWRDFYMNHWRRGADRAKLAEIENDDEPPAAPNKKSRTTKLAKTTAKAPKKASAAIRGTSSRGRGGRGGGASRPVARRIDADDDFEGDLGGPSAPPMRSGFRGRGGKAWYSKRGAARKKKR